MSLGDRVSPPMRAAIRRADDRIVAAHGAKAPGMEMVNYEQVLTAFAGTGMNVDDVAALAHHVAQACVAMIALYGQREDPVSVITGPITQLLLVGALYDDGAGA